MRLREEPWSRTHGMDGGGAGVPIYVADTGTVLLVYGKQVK